MVVYSCSTLGCIPIIYQFLNLTWNGYTKHRPGVAILSCPILWNKHSTFWYSSRFVFLWERSFSSKFKLYTTGVDSYLWKQSSNSEEAALKIGFQLLSPTEALLGQKKLVMLPYLNCTDQLYESHPFNPGPFHNSTQGEIMHFCSTPSSGCLFGEPFVLHLIQSIHSTLEQ